MEANQWIGLMEPRPASPTPGRAAPTLGQLQHRQGQEVDHALFAQEVVSEVLLGLGDRVAQPLIATAIALQHAASGGECQPIGQLDVQQRGRW